MKYSLAIDLKYQTEAYGLIMKFQRDNDPTVKVGGTKYGFSQIEFYDIVEQLLKRVEDPFSIDQGKVNLCGPAAVMYCWLCKRPDLFVQYVINLYERGKGRMGSLFVQPGDDCRNHKPQNIHGVDWVALAALRDSENSKFDFDSEPNYLGSITMPEDIEKWFGNIGFNVLENRTSLMWNEEYKALQKAAEHFIQGKCVCLLINAKVLSGEGVNLSANHWVVITTEPTINGKSIASLPYENGILDQPIDFNVYTWGMNWSVTLNNKGQTIFLKNFLDCFYGFIAAECNENSVFSAKVSLLAD